MKKAKVNPATLKLREIKVKVICKLDLFAYFCRHKILTCGVIGNTSDFGSEVSWFEPRQVNGRDVRFKM